MKTRTLFLTLITSISILLIAQGFAFADSITGCLKKSTGKIYNAQIETEPILPCGMFDEEISWNQEGPPQFILKDSTGAQVGTVITVNDDSVGFFDANGFQVSNRSVLTAIDIQKADTTTATVAISVDRFNIRFQHRLLFEDINCVGSPRHKEVIVDVDFPPAFTMAAVVVGDPDQPDARRLYIQTDQAENPQMREIKSVFFDDGCSNFFTPMSILTVSMVLIDGVLDQFPGPYTLEGPAGADGGGAGKVVAFGRVSPSGEIAYDGAGNFTVQHAAGTNEYVITINEPMDCRGFEQSPGIFIGRASYDRSDTNIAIREYTKCIPRTDTPNVS